jgi:hypothetical protein
MKNIILIIALISGMLSQVASTRLYTCKNARISLFSTAPMEDIEGISSAGKSVYNADNGELMFTVPMRSFRFKKSLMKEHFNENYVESDKYPNATFKGKIAETIDPAANGTYPVTVTGVLDVHGVKQNRTVKGTVTVNNGTVTMAAEFMVKCVDHKIEIPTLVFKNIAETIKMNVSASYTPFKN